MKGLAVIVFVAAVFFVITAAADSSSVRPAFENTSTAQHTAEHATMTQQMGVGGSPEMMASDPMWRMMREPAHIRAEEDYQRDIDRMLGRQP